MVSRGGRYGAGQSQHRLRDTFPGSWAEEGVTGLSKEGSAEAGSWRRNLWRTQSRQRNQQGAWQRAGHHAIGVATELMELEFMA